MRKEKRMVFKAIIFDMDGVIVDSEPVYLARYDDFLKHNKKQAEWSHTWKVLREIWSDYIERNEFYDEFNDFYKGNLIDYTDLMDEDISYVLKKLKSENYKLALASSSPYNTIHMVLNDGNLNGIFDEVVSGEDFKESKPNPEIYISIAEKLEVAPMDCLVIEDSSYGIKAAKKAGMYVLAKEDKRFNFNQELADKKIKDLEEILFF